MSCRADSLRPGVGIVHWTLAQNCDGPSALMIVASTDDTDPVIKALLIEGYRRMSPSQKMERVRALTRAVQELALADIRRRHPDANDRERALRLASRWIEPDRFVRAFAWDVRTIGYRCCPSHCSSSRAWFGGIGHTPAAASGAAVPMAVQNGIGKSRSAWAVSQPPGRPGAHEQQSGIEAIKAGARQLLPLSNLPISDLSRFHARPAEHRILSPARLP
jgi:hypothetical protein